MDWLKRFHNHPALNLEQFKEENISEAERKRIGYSIAQFQRGESSEARDFLGKSKIFAAESGDPRFLAESKLFVKEENYHSYLLEIFMKQMQIDFATESWSDSVFRWIRSFGDIAWSSRVLLTAEIIAQVYYPALKEASSSAMMQTICERIIEDEEDHILFQTERIARVLRRHGQLFRSLHWVLGLVLFWGTAVVVWFEHQDVLAKSLSYGQYLRTCSGRYQFALSQLNQHLASNEAELRERRSPA